MQPALQALVDRFTADLSKAIKDAAHALIAGGLEAVSRDLDVRPANVPPRPTSAKAPAPKSAPKLRPAPSPAPRRPTL